MSQSMRAADLEARLGVTYKNARSSLIWVLYKSHRSHFNWQWGLTVVQSIIAYGPQYCMYKILKLLEQQHRTQVKHKELMFWAIGLGMIRLLQTLLEAR